ASFRQVIDGLHRVLVRHLGHVELFRLQPRRKKQIVRTGDRCIIQFAGLGLDFRRKLLDRRNIQVRRDAKRDERVGNARDRHQFFRIVGQLVVQQRVRGKRGRRRKQQHVVVMRTEHSRNGEEGVASWSVFDDDRLAPLRRQLVGNQSRRDIDARAGSEWNDETNGTLRPLLGRCLRLYRKRREDRKKAKCNVEKQTR